MKADVDQKSGGLKRDLTARSEAPASRTGASIVRSRLFFKYTLLFVTVVVLALVANGGFEVWFSYQEHKGSLIGIQEQQAIAAADKIEEFITQIESQVGWTTQLPWTDGTLDQRRFDALRLLRQVPAITELAQIDAAGHEQLKVSRLTMDAGRQRHRLLAEAGIHASRGAQGVLRPGLLSPGIRAVHDAVARRHPA